MPSNNHKVDEVLQDNSLIDPLIAKDSVIARRYAKGIVLCQQIGFSKGSYANLKQLKSRMMHSNAVIYGQSSECYN